MAKNKPLIVGADPVEPILKSGDLGVLAVVIDEWREAHEYLEEMGQPRVDRHGKEIALKERIKRCLAQ